MPGSLLGGHSHSHAIMSFLDEPALEREIRLPLQLLQSKAGVRTSHFPIPRGYRMLFRQRDRGVAAGRHPVLPDR
ncbi:hypothetical protein ABNQ38_06635 (plasmid) [Azospirillum sp. A29]|uniref:hypothetical protein n=1 Tax=Azospirillum sp. A29 TaxID=3160606 RepID=UPI00366C7344